jgi:3D (Asp-Asp-Asp) domain-containing protein
MLVRATASVLLAGAMVGMTLVGAIASSEAENEVVLRGDDSAFDINAHARVTGTFGRGLLVREGPGTSYPTRVSLAEGTRVQVVAGPRPDREGQTWYQIMTLAQPQTRGWSSAQYLVEIDPNSPEPVLAAAVPVIAHSVTPARSFTAKLTAYTYQTPGNGAHGSITRSGTQVRWGTVAVDPSVIPLGSRLMIDGYDTIFVAEDTGYGVIGNHVDVFFYDHDSAVRFGVQYRTVTVLQ